MSYTAHWTDLNESRTEIEALPGPTVLEFGVDWCPHCQNAQDALQQALQTHLEVRHLKAEDGKGRPLGRAFGVKVWPNFVLLRDGLVVQQLARPEPGELQAAIAQLNAASA